MRGGPRIVVAIGAASALLFSYLIAQPPAPTPAGAVDRAFELSLQSLDEDARAEVQQIALQPFEDCAELLSYFKEEAVVQVNGYGLPWGGGFGRGGMEFMTADGAVGRTGAVTAAEAPALAPVPQRAAGVDDASADAGFSTTNVQEVGVDEPDQIKTDGEHIYFVRGEHIIAVRAGESLTVVDRLRLKNTWGVQLLLAGDRLLAIAPDGGAIAYAEEGTRPAKPWRARTGMHVIDVSDPANMSKVETLWVEGNYVSARMVDEIARVVVRTAGPAIAFATPGDGDARTFEEATDVNRARIKASRLDAWLPRYQITEDSITQDTVAPSGGDPMTSCGRVRRPPEFSGLDMVSVLTVDPADPTPREAATVVGVGETVYASTTGLYVTTNEWAGSGPIGIAVPEPALVDPSGDIVVSSPVERAAEPRMRTIIHRFDISDPRQATYDGSGAVPGSLLNQWSLSEHEGHLRVVTTTGGFTGETESRVTVLNASGPALERVGVVRGLGKTERVYAVRFMGETGYVVTFRQVDPLYVIDLSDPTNPRQRGELKIPGFSSYLHPVEDGRLLGLGQDATLQGRLRGVQVSLFDVRDPDDPRQVDKIGFGLDTQSIAQDDHRAFLWWAAEALAVFPLGGYDRDTGNYLSGATAVRIDGDELVRAGSITHPVTDQTGGGSSGKGIPEDFASPYSPEIQRALVIGGTLYTVSDAGLMASDLDSLSERDWLPWPAA